MEESRLHPFRRAPRTEPNRIINLRKFAQWVHDRRSERGLSLEVLARYISQAGYPISQNKLYRIEQNLKEEGEQKRPLQTIDYELLIRLEDVLDDRFISDEEARIEEMVSVRDVVELLKNVAATGAEKIGPPEDAALRKVYDALKAVLKK
jgi:hypothetical protein